MAADDLATEGARSSAAMALTLKNKWILVFAEERFQLPAASQC